MNERKRESFTIFSTFFLIFKEFWSKSSVFSSVEPRNKHGGGDVWNEAIAEQTVSSSEGSSSTPTHQRAQTPKKLRRHKTGVLSPQANNNER